MGNNGRRVIEVLFGLATRAGLSPPESKVLRVNRSGGTRDASRAAMSENQVGPDTRHPSRPDNQSAGQIPRCFAMNPNFTSIPSRSRPQLYGMARPSSPCRGYGGASGVVGMYESARHF